MRACQDRVWTIRICFGMCGPRIFSRRARKRFAFAKQTRKSGEENVGRHCREAILGRDGCFSFALFHLYFFVFARRQNTKQNPTHDSQNVMFRWFFPCESPNPPNLPFHWVCIFELEFRLNVSERNQKKVRFALVWPEWGLIIQAKWCGQRCKWVI